MNDANNQEQDCQTPEEKERAAQWKMIWPISNIVGITKSVRVRVHVATERYCGQTRDKES